MQINTNTKITKEDILKVLKNIKHDIHHKMILYQLNEVCFSEKNTEKEFKKSKIDHKRLFIINFTIFFSIAPFINSAVISALIQNFNIYLILILVLVSNILIASSICLIVYTIYNEYIKSNYFDIMYNLNKDMKKLYDDERNLTYIIENFSKEHYLYFVENNFIINLDDFIEKFK